MSFSNSPNRVEKADSREQSVRSSDLQASSLDQIIDTKIDDSCRAIWRAELIRSTLRLAIILISAIFAWVICDQWIFSPGPAIRVAAFSCLIALVLTYAWRYLLPISRSTVHRDYAAKSLERDIPNLRQSLISYLTLRDDRASRGLRGSVVRSLGSITSEQLKHHDALPREATGTVGWWIATIAGIALLAAYVLVSPKSSVQAAARLVAPLADIAPAQRVSITDVKPGNTAATAGRPMDISAKVKGLYDGDQVVCRWESVAESQEFELSLNSDTQRYEGQLDVPNTAVGNLTYTLLADDASAGPFELAVQDLPVVAIDEIQYQPPAYTQIGSFSKGAGAIRAPDGTKIRLIASANRPVEKAKIEFNPMEIGGRLQATAGVMAMEVDASGTQLSIELTLRSATGLAGIKEKDSYRILVWDAINQRNIEPIIYPIQIIPDLPPEIAITIPNQTPKDLPYNAQQLVEVHASDPDFGLKSIQLEIHYGINQIIIPTLWESAEGEKGHQVASIPFRPEELKLSIGDTVEMVAIAIDNRIGDESVKLSPNVIRTDPVELRISSPSTLPETDDPTADGVSKPKSESSESSSNTDESGDEQGAGGSGSGDATSSQEAGEQQGDESTSNQSSDSNEEGADDSDGTSGSNVKDNQESSSSNQTQDSSEGPGDPSSDPSTGPSDADQSDSPDNAPDNSPNQSDAVQNSDMNDKSNRSNSESADETTRNTNQQPDDAEGSKMNQEGDPSGSNQQNTTEQNGSDSNSQNPDSEGASGEDAMPDSEASETESGSADESDSSGNGREESNSSTPRPQTEQSKPGHDGEAFERIKDFIDQQNANDMKQSGATGQQPKDDASRQSPESGLGQDDSDSGSTSNQEKQEESQGPAADQDSQASNEQASDDSNDSESGTSESSSEVEENRSGSEQTMNADSDASAGQDSEPSGNQDTGSNADQSKISDSDAASESGQEQPESDASDNASQNAATNSNDSQTGTENADSEDSNQDNPDQQNANSETKATQENSVNPSLTDPERPADTQTTGQPSGKGSDVADDLTSLREQNLELPDEVNLDYAKQATDLVLDYLEQTRDRPDQELLDELQWTNEELRDFTERWEKIRDLPKVAGQEGERELQESLQSLGMRKPKSMDFNQREETDAMGPLKDAGNSQPAPAAYRDAFNAFRRAMSQTK